MEVLAVNQRGNATVDIVQLSASSPDSGSTARFWEYRNVLRVPPAGGCIFFMENDHDHHHHHSGGNSKVGVDLVKNKNNTRGNKFLGGSCVKTTHTHHTHRSSNDVGSKHHLRQIIKEPQERQKLGELATCLR